MTQISSIIDLLGGPSAAARAAGVGASTAGEWKRAGSIPVKYWPALLALAQDRGVALDERCLMLAHCPSEPAQESAAASAGKAAGESR